MLMQMIWHDLVAYQVETRALRMVVVPQLGGRVVSLFDRARKWEWLAQPRQAPAGEVPYAASYADYGLFGWDEMFPTIDVCTLPEASGFGGVTLPDHGEVWALPWRVEQADEQALTLSVLGRALPYTLTRQIAADGDGLVLRYLARNLSDRPLPYLWTAHPSLAVPAGTQLRVDRAIDQVVLVAAAPNTGLTPGLASYPQAGGLTLDTIRPLAAASFRKWYLRPDARIFACQVVTPEGGPRLGFTWADTLPHFGVWMDEGVVYPVAPIMTPEPASGFYDSLSHCLATGHVRWLSAHGSAEWWMRVEGIRAD
jgi:hypothetical protein